MKSSVSIVRCEDYTPSEVLRAVKEATDLLGGLGRFVLPGQRVLLKPNLLSARPPSDAVTTHPAVVEATIGLVTSLGGRCAVGDSPCITGESPEGYRKVLSATGMQDVIDRTGAEILRFDDSSTERVVPEAKVFRKLPVTDALAGADVFINIPKFKTHQLTTITGAVKNLFGCVPGKQKIEFHLQSGDNPQLFAQMLVDLLRTVRPTLSIMDAVAGMDGQGPSAGRRRKFGLIIASDDPVALDAIACMAGGVDPLSIPMLRLAHEQGLGVADPANIHIAGALMKDVAIPDFRLPSKGDMVSRMPKFLYRTLRNQLIRRPVFRPDACAGCGFCAKTCPVHAISGEEKDLRIDYSACISCYCCQEVCPEEAIGVRTGWMRRLMDSCLSSG